MCIQQALTTLECMTGMLNEQKRFVLFYIVVEKKKSYNLHYYAHDQQLFVMILNWITLIELTFSYVHYCAIIKEVIWSTNPLQSYKLLQ